MNELLVEAFFEEAQHRSSEGRNRLYSSYFRERNQILHKWPAIGKSLYLSFIYAASDIVSDIIFHLYGLETEILFSQEGSFPRLATLWINNGRNGQIFVFKAFVSLDYHARMTVDRWLNCMNLFSTVQKQGGFLGAAYVNFDDCGNGHGLNACDSVKPEALIPDTYFLGSGGYDEARTYFRDNIKTWSDRSDRVFWRGSTTGQPPSIGSLLPRIALCLLGKRVPDLNSDFAITDSVQLNQQDMQFIKDNDLMGPFVAWTSLNNYKFHIDIDGNTNSFPGLFMKLLSGGLVFKVASQFGYRQWYYDKLRDGENFVSVKSDLSDLPNKLEFYRQNPDLSRAIAQAGNTLAISMSHGAELQDAANNIQKYILSRA